MKEKIIRLDDKESMLFKEITGKEHPNRMVSEVKTLLYVALYGNRIGAEWMENGALNVLKELERKGKI